MVLILYTAQNQPFWKFSIKSFQKLTDYFVLLMILDLSSAFYTVDDGMSLSSLEPKGGVLKKTDPSSLIILFSRQDDKKLAGWKCSKV